MSVMINVESQKVNTMDWNESKLQEKPSNEQPACSLKQTLAQKPTLGARQNKSKDFTVGTNSIWKGMNFNEITQIRLHARYNLHEIKRNNKVIPTETEEERCRIKLEAKDVLTIQPHEHWGVLEPLWVMYHDLESAEDSKSKKSKRYTVPDNTISTIERLQIDVDRLLKENIGLELLKEIDEPNEKLKSHMVGMILQKSVSELRTFRKKRSVEDLVQECREKIAEHELRDLVQECREKFVKHELRDLVQECREKIAEHELREEPILSSECLNVDRRVKILGERNKTGVIVLIVRKDNYPPNYIVEIDSTKEVKDRVKYKVDQIALIKQYQEQEFLAVMENICPKACEFFDGTKFDGTASRTDENEKGKKIIAKDRGLTVVGFKASNEIELGEIVNLMKAIVRERTDITFLRWAFFTGLFVRLKCATVEQAESLIVFIRNFHSGLYKKNLEIVLPNNVERCLKNKTVMNTFKSQELDLDVQIDRPQKKKKKTRKRNRKRKDTLTKQQPKKRKLHRDVRTMIAAKDITNKMFPECGLQTIGHSKSDTVPKDNCKQPKTIAFIVTGPNLRLKVDELLSELTPEDYKKKIRGEDSVYDLSSYPKVVSEKMGNSENLTSLRFKVEQTNLKKYKSIISVQVILDDTIENINSPELVEFLRSSCENMQKTYRYIRGESKDYVHPAVKCVNKAIVLLDKLESQEDEPILNEKKKKKVDVIDVEPIIFPFLLVEMLIRKILAMDTEGRIHSAEILRSLFLYFGSKLIDQMRGDDLARFFRKKDYDMVLILCQDYQNCVDCLESEVALFQFFEMKISNKMNASSCYQTVPPVESACFDLTQIIPTIVYQPYPNYVWVDPSHVGPATPYVVPTIFQSQPHPQFFVQQHYDPYVYAQTAQFSSTI